MLKGASPTSKDGVCKREKTRVFTLRNSRLVNRLSNDRDRDEFYSGERYYVYTVIAYVIAIQNKLIIDEKIKRCVQHIF